MTSVRYDFDRPERIGMPEAVLCEGKDSAILSKLVEELRERRDHPVLLTRLDQVQYQAFSPAARAVVEYDALSRTAFLNGCMPPRPGRVAVVTAGTSDLAVAGEAHRTGYGVASGGRSALHSMLGSCAQGMAVMNIDNGFGAACAAVRMLGLKSPLR